MAGIIKSGRDALLIIPDAGTLDLGGRIVAFGLQHRIPVVSSDADLTSIGGLISYGVSRRESLAIWQRTRCGAIRSSASGP